MNFDPAAETKKYIDSLGPEALEKAASYTIGNHWLLLAGLVISALVTWIIVRWGILDRVARRFEKRGFVLRTWLVCATYFLVNALISMPWGLYQEYWREKSYGRTSQPLGDFLAQDALGIGLSTVLGGLFFMGVYALIRRMGRRWWLWSGGFAALGITLLLLIAPVLIEPIFNDYKPVPAGPVRTAIETLADEAGIPRTTLLPTQAAFLERPGLQYQMLL
jgi:STE24 endopeptidase